MNPEGRVWLTTASHGCKSLSLSKRRLRATQGAIVHHGPSTANTDATSALLDTCRTLNQPLSSRRTILLCQSRHRRWHRNQEQREVKVGWMPSSGRLMHPHVSGICRPCTSLPRQRQFGLCWFVAFSSWKSEDSRVIAAAYDRRVWILQACKRTLGRSVTPKQVIGTDAQSALDCCAGKLPRCTSPKPELHRGWLSDCSATQALWRWGAGPPSDDS